jgi:hypothetical protein
MWATFTAADAAAVVTALAPRLPGPPVSYQVDYADADPATWPASALAAEEVALARWDGASVAYTAGRWVNADLPDLVSELAVIPFEVATFPSYGDVWAAEHHYRAPSFGGGHGPHGWACAFRGPGHARLVSRRWLDQPCWELRADADISFVRFHDPAAGPAAALAAARPGHERMGITHIGGYLQSPPVPVEVPGLYDPGARRFTVVVLDREVPQPELLDACQLRRRQVEPIDELRYVFADPGQAHRMLHELWLREITCVALIDGTEQVLTP